MKKMSRAAGEVALIGGGVLVAPVVACMVAMPLYMAIREPVLAMVVGTVVGMGLFASCCWLHARAHPGTGSSED